MARKMLGQNKAAQDADADTRLAQLLSGSKQLQESRKEMSSQLALEHDREISDDEDNDTPAGVTIKEIVAAPAAEIENSLDKEFEKNEGEINNRMHSLKHVSYRWRQPPSTPL